VVAELLPTDAVALVEHLAKRGVDVLLGLEDRALGDLANTLVEALAAKYTPGKNDLPNLLASGFVPKDISMDSAGSKVRGELTNILQKKLIINQSIHPIPSLAHRV
jgi:hypothetical protein